MAVSYSTEKMRETERERFKRWNAEGKEKKKKKKKELGHTSDTVQIEKQKVRRKLST